MRASGWTGVRHTRGGGHVIKNKSNLATTLAAIFGIIVVVLVVGYLAVVLLG